MNALRLCALSLAVGGLGLLALFAVGTCWYAINEWRRKERAMLAETPKKQKRAKEGNGR